MRQRTWIVLGLAGAGGTSVGLLFVERGIAASLWVLAPLTLLLVASARYPMDPVAAVVQIVVITVAGVGAGGNLSRLGWGLSIWDAVVICELMALAVGIAAGRQRREHWYGEPVPPTPIRGPIAGAVGRVLTWTAFAIMCCAGGLFALAVHPVKPPTQLVYALPEGVSVADERTLCERPAGTCTVILEVDGSQPSAELLRDELAAYYVSYYGRPADSSQPACRARGWLAQEHACVSVAVSETYVFVPPTLDFRATVPALLPETIVTVAITYW